MAPQVQSQEPSARLLPTSLKEVEGSGGGRAERMVFTGVPEEKLLLV